MNFSKVADSIIDKSKSVDCLMQASHTLYKNDSLHHILWANERKMKEMECTDGQWLEGWNEKKGKRLFQVALLLENEEDVLFCSPYYATQSWTLTRIVNAKPEIPVATEVVISMVKEMTYVSTEIEKIVEFFSIDRVCSVGDLFGICNEGKYERPLI